MTRRRQRWRLRATLFQTSPDRTREHPADEIPQYVPKKLRSFAARFVEQYGIEQVQGLVKMIRKGIPSLSDQPKVLERCLQIIDEPYSGTPMKDSYNVAGLQEHKLWKAYCRTKWRILYTITDGRAIILKVGDRADIYGRGHSN